MESDALDGEVLPPLDPPLDVVAYLAQFGITPDDAVSISQDQSPCPATEIEFAIQLLRNQMRQLTARMDQLEARHGP